VKEAKKCKCRNLCVFEEERMDVCRAVISGIAETPYVLGLFVFDIFFPTMYPTVPPLVTFMTAGESSTFDHPFFFYIFVSRILLLAAFLHLGVLRWWSIPVQPRPFTMTGKSASLCWGQRMPGIPPNSGIKTRVTGASTHVDLDADFCPGSLL
jgi:hypothetical protein